jgi:hypothetical protein
MLESTLVRTFPAYANLPWYQPITGAAGGGGGPANPLVADDGGTTNIITDDGDTIIYEELP